VVEPVEEPEAMTSHLLPGPVVRTGDEPVEGHGHVEADHGHRCCPSWCTRVMYPATARPACGKRRRGHEYAWRSPKGVELEPGEAGQQRPAGEPHGAVEGGQEGLRQP